MRGYRVERKGGWDCHGLPVEIAVEQELGIKSKAEVEDVRDRRVQRALPRVGVHLPGGVEPADRADRLLAGPRRRLPHARRELHRVGLVGAVADQRARAALRGPQGRARTARAARRRCPRTRWRWATSDVVDPSVYLQLPVSGDRGSARRTSCWCGRRRRGRCRATWRVAVSPSASYARARFGDDHFVLVADRVAAVLGEQAEVIERFSGERAGGALRQLRGADLRSERPRAGPARRSSRTTSSRPRKARHRAPGAGVRRGRLPRRGGGAGIFDGDEPHTLYNPVRPDGTYDGRVRDRDGDSGRAASSRTPS